MYKNLALAMKVKGVTYAQIAESLNCRYQTVSDKINGNTESGFYFEDAVRIKKIHFPEYDMEYLFDRSKNIA